MKLSSPNSVPFHVPLIEEDDIGAVREVMETGWITTGPKAIQFEQEFARFIGAPHAISVNSCTAALHVALEAAGIAEGDEVIVPTLTFAATAEAVLYLKARPVLTDCEPDTFNLNPMLVERAITPRTRAIVPVHFAGQPCDMTRLLEIAKRYNLKVIEDAAHALPARYKGSMVGTLGDLTCFSFYATKNITTAEGGMVTTEREDWADRMRVMRLHGISKDAWKRYSAEGSWQYEIVAPGFKYNLTDMQAALGITQLAKCNAMWLRRSELAHRYTEALSLLDAFEVPAVRLDIEHAWHLYVLRVCPGVLSIHRNRLIEELKARGIGASVHFIPLHTHPYYRNTWGYHMGDFRVAEDYFDRCISLPLYPAMSDDDQMRVIDALTEIAVQYRRFSPSAITTPEEAEKHRPNGAFAHLGMEEESSAVRQGERPQAESEGLPQATMRLNLNHRRYRQAGKRMLDILGATTGLLAAIPLLAACAAAVRLGSRGPVLFRQSRVGRDGRTFDLLKFRSMAVGEGGSRITAAGDPRVTGVGRWLRRWKLDELPQLINVLKGEMSLVGPRPEVPEYVAIYSARQMDVFKARPGITSPASLAYIDEEQTLAGQMNNERFYTEVLLPRKLDLDLEYCGNIGLAADLRILLATARRLMPGNRGERRVGAGTRCPAPPGSAV